MKILIGDIMLAMVSRKFLQVYQFLSVRIIYSKNLMQLFDRDQFPLWQHFLGELRGDIFNKASEITTPGSTNNYWFGLRYSSRTFNRTIRVENR